MSLPNDSVLVTPGSGATIATHTVSSKEYQVVMEADALGHIKGSRNGWFVWFTPATNASNRSVGDLFNADPAIVVRVQGLWIIPTLTAITGVAISYDINRTSAVGTGGTTETPRPVDTAQTALDADITARSGATGGATLVYKYWSSYSFNDETNPSTGFGGLINQLPIVSDKVVEIVLRQNQGLQVKQSNAAAVGLTGALMYFTTE